MFSHREIRIEVGSSGRFLAKVKDVDISEISLEATKAAIDKALTHIAKSRTLNLKVVGLLSKGGWREERRDSIHRATLTGINRTTGELMVDGVPKEHNFKQVMADTPAAEQKLKEFMRIKAELDVVAAHLDKFSLRSGRNGRVDAEKYEAMLDNLEQQYSICKHEHS